MQNAGGYILVSADIEIGIQFKKLIQKKKNIYIY